MPTVTTTKSVTSFGSASYSLLHCFVFGIVNMIYALGHNDVECNVPHHSMDLDLGDFLFWFAISMYVMIGATMLTYTGLGCYVGGASGAGVGVAAAGAVLIFLTGLFMLAWSIVGAIILFQDAIGCIESQDAVGILTLVNLIVYWSSGYFYVNTTTAVFFAKSEDVD